MSKTFAELAPPFVHLLDTHGVSPRWVPERCSSLRLEKAAQSTGSCPSRFSPNDSGLSSNMYNCKALLQKARSCEWETNTRNYKNCAIKKNTEKTSATSGDTDMREPTLGAGHTVAVCPKQEVPFGFPSHVEHDIREFSIDMGANELWHNTSANESKYERMSALPGSPDRSYSLSEHYGLRNVERAQVTTTISDCYGFNLVPRTGYEQAQKIREKSLSSITGNQKAHVSNETCNTRTTVVEQGTSALVNESLLSLTGRDGTFSSLGAHKSSKDLMIHSLTTRDEPRKEDYERGKLFMDGCTVSPRNLPTSDVRTAQDVSVADGNMPTSGAGASPSKHQADGSPLLCFPAPPVTGPSTTMADLERDLRVQGNPAVRRSGMASSMVFVTHHDNKSGYSGTLPQSAPSFLPNRIYKTKICVHNLRGRCARAGNCSFAHAPTELRERPNLFKTRLCVNFTTCGTCVMGSNCRFAHGEAELRQAPETLGFITDLGIQQSNMVARNTSLSEDFHSADDPFNLFPTGTQRTDWETESIRNFGALEQQQQSSRPTSSFIPSLSHRKLVEGSLKDTTAFRVADQHLDYKETSPTQTSTGTPIESGLAESPMQASSKTLPIGSVYRSGGCIDDTKCTHVTRLSPGGGAFCQPQPSNFRGYCNIAATLIDAPTPRPSWMDSHTTKKPLTRQLLVSIYVPPPAAGTITSDATENFLCQNEPTGATALLWNGKNGSMLSEPAPLALDPNALEPNYPPAIRSALAAIDIRQQLLVRELEVLSYKVTALHSERQRLLHQYDIKDLGSAGTMVLKEQRILSDLALSGVLMGASTHASSGLHIHMRTAETSRMGSFETFPPPSVLGMSRRESTQGAHPTTDGSTTVGNDDEHFIYSAIQNVVGPLDTPYFHDSSRWVMRDSSRRCSLAPVEFDAPKSLSETRVDALEKPGGRISDMLSTGPAGVDSDITDLIPKPFGSDVLSSVGAPKETMTCSPLIPLNTSYNRAFGAPPRLGRRSTFSNTASTLWEVGRYLSNVSELPSILSGSRRISNANGAHESNVLGSYFAPEKKHNTVLNETQMYSRKYSLGHHDLFGPASQRSTFCSQYPVYSQENEKQIHQITKLKDSEGDKTVAN